jgi:hypothetical protein
MRKKTIFLLYMLFIVPLIAGIYGIIHDQITYSISSEYYTNNKFIQFGISETLRETERLAVCFVGFLATWWVGIPVALFSGGIGIKKLDIQQFRKLKISSIIITLIITFLFGVIGYFYGLVKFSSISDMPLNIGGKQDNSELFLVMIKVKDWSSFLIVGTIHNFSYLGGLVGLIVSIIYQIRVLRTTDNISLKS